MDWRKGGIELKRKYVHAEIEIKAIMGYPFGWLDVCPVDQGYSYCDYG